MENNILICDCLSVEHQIVISRYTDDSYNSKMVLAQIHLSSNRGFFSRLKHGIKYIFGYKCKYGDWDKFVFNPEDVDKLQGMVDFLIQEQSDTTNPPQKSPAFHQPHKEQSKTTSSPLAHTGAYALCQNCIKNEREEDGKVYCSGEGVKEISKLQNQPSCAAQCIY